MKLCFIPPKGLEDRMTRGSMVMALAPQVIASTQYAHSVRTLGHLNRKVILDNGANEEQPIEIDKMVYLANHVRVHEIVISDVLKDSDATMEAVDTDMRSLVKRDYYGRIMAVVQANGEDPSAMDDLRRCVAFYAHIKRITTIGIPRHLVTNKRRAIRIDLANWIAETFPGRFAIHLLGTSPVWLPEVCMARKYAPHIRSVDTSLPYNYGLEGYKLDAPPPFAIWRPSNYFTSDHARHKLLYIMQHNEDVMRRWAEEEIGADPTPVG